MTRAGCVMVMLVAGWVAPVGGQQPTGPPGPGTFRQAALEMGGTLSSQQVLERLLQGRPVLELARWWMGASATPDETLQMVTRAGAEDVAAVQDAYGVGGLEGAAREMERQGVTAGTMRAAIVEWGAARPARGFIERALRGDQSELELLRVLSGEPPLAERLARFQEWANQGWSAAQALQLGMPDFSMDQMAAALLAAGLDDERRATAFLTLGLADHEVAERLYRLRDPNRLTGYLQEHGYDEQSLAASAITLTNDMTAADVQPLLAARERAMSGWLQTAGPGVDAVFVGWHQRPPDGVDLSEIVPVLDDLPAEEAPLDEALEPLLAADPELIAVVYQDGTLRVRWFTREGDPEQVSAFYQGKVEVGAPPPETLTLKVDYARLGPLASARDLALTGLRFVGGETWIVGEVDGRPLLFKRHVGYAAALGPNAPGPGGRP